LSGPFPYGLIERYALAVVAPVLNDEGEPIDPARWNQNLMDLPVVEDQNSSSFTAVEIETISALGSFTL
jgi:hypothetical protein